MASDMNTSSSGNTGHHRSSSDVPSPTALHFRPSPNSRLLGASSVQDLRRANNGLSPERGYPRTMADVTSPTPRKSLSKERLNKLYDTKLGTRHPAAIALSSAAPSSSTHSLASSSLSGGNINAQGNVDDSWQTLNVHVLPLFNGEQLGRPIEDLNLLVRQHIQSVVSRGFSRALATIEAHIMDLVASGMLTLSAKLSSLEDEKLLTRMIEIWIHFFDQILPYVEGVFLPAHTDSLLLSLHRTKANRAASPTFSDSSARSSSSHHIDVRRLTLKAFRDSVVLPVCPKLLALVTNSKKSTEAVQEHQPRLQQMLLVLTSVSGHNQFSLIPARHGESGGDQAIAQLLRAVRNPGPQQSNQLQRNISRMSTFMSAGAPRDRRGRVARKSFYGSPNADEENDDGTATPKNRPAGWDREKEREILASLRSTQLDAHRASIGGWGLGIGKEVRVEDEDEDEEQGDWDKSKVAEHFVGLKAGEIAQDGRRRGLNVVG